MRVSGCEELNDRDTCSVPSSRSSEETIPADNVSLRLYAWLCVCDIV